MIDYVTEEAFRNAYDAFAREAEPHDTKRYEDWLRLHTSVVDLAKTYGEWTDHWERGDFYHGGDWFTSLTDGFALLTAKPLKKIRFTRFQQIVAAHSPFARLTIDGEIDGPSERLELIIHPKVILACWRGKSREECRRHMASLGIKEV